MIDLLFSTHAAKTLINALYKDIPNNVLALHFALDIGNISNVEDDLSARQSVLNLLYGEYGSVSKEIFESSKIALKKLQETSESKEHVRIWLSDTNPASLCGLYYTCSILDEDVPISIVRLPTQKVDGKVVAHHPNSDDDVKTFAKFIKSEEVLSTPERNYYAIAWKELAVENAPLRVVVNSKLLGVPENVYDLAIKHNLPDGEILCAKLIGKTLIMVPGVSNRWLYVRIREMVKNKELIEISPAEYDYPYSAVYKKA